MSQRWYYTRQGEQVGPVTEEQLRDLLTSGRIVSSEQVWREGAVERLSPERALAIHFSHIDTSAGGRGPNEPPPFPPGLRGKNPALGRSQVSDDAQESVRALAAITNGSSDEPPPFPPSFGRRSPASLSQLTSLQRDSSHTEKETTATAQRVAGAQGEGEPQTTNEQSFATHSAEVGKGSPLSASSRGETASLAARPSEAKSVVAEVERLILLRNEQGLKAYLDGAARDILAWHQTAEAGAPDVQYLVGLCYEWGSGVAKDSTKMTEWLRKAADQGYARAQFTLGVCYCQGRGVPRDFGEAVKWFRKAAERDDVTAQHNLGACYCQGRGVPQDFGEAVKWYRKAAEQGHAFAQDGLGSCYCEGQGVPQDFGEAVKWFRKAAEQGNATAQYNLGVCYQNGQGVPQNREEGLMWIRKAAAQGEPNATAFLQRLRARNIQWSIAIISGAVPILLFAFSVWCGFSGGGKVYGTWLDVQKMVQNRSQQEIVAMLGKPDFINTFGTLADHSDDEVWVYYKRLRHPVTGQTQDADVHFAHGICNYVTSN